MLTISETAALIGVTPATLRRWDKKGYLVPKRTLGNHRRYTWEQLADFLPDSVEIEKNNQDSQIKNTYISISNILDKWLVAAHSRRNPIFQSIS